MWSRYLPEESSIHASSIHEVSGDILLTAADVIVHGVAPNDPFQSGLALALREKWPAMYAEFTHHAQAAHAKPGSIWNWAGSSDSGPIQIVALLTQEGSYELGATPGPAHLSFVHHALKSLRNWIQNENIQSIALPRLATGGGGLPWGDVYALIRQHLGSLNIPVFVYTTYQPGVRADEKLAFHTRVAT